MATEDARKLFMAGLPDSVTEEVLRGLFNETGANVTELTLPRDRATGRPRGFAFVRLGSEDEAERARQELDGRIVDGKMISVRPFHADPPAGGAPGSGPRERGPREGGAGGGGGFDRPRGGGGGGGGPGAPDRTLYVGNLPYDATQEEVDALLRNSGAEGVARVYLPVDQDGRKRGFGFVTMISPEAANGAIEALKGVDLRGRKLIVNIAHPKGERPPRPEGGMGGGGGGGGGFDRPPRSFGGPPGGGFGGPPPPGRSPKGEGRKRKFEEGPNREGAGGAKKNREREEKWRDREDDDW
jgi:RNA recognition motif-containing protein